MLDKKVSELLNTQVNKEFYSAYLYMLQFPDVAWPAVILK